MPNNPIEAAAAAVQSTPFFLGSSAREGNNRLRNADEIARAAIVAFLNSVAETDEIARIITPRAFGIGCGNVSEKGQESARISASYVIAALLKLAE